MCKYDSGYWLGLGYRVRDWIWNQGTRAAKVMSRDCSLVSDLVNAPPTQAITHLLLIARANWLTKNSQLMKKTSQIPTAYIYTGRRLVIPLLKLADRPVAVARSVELMNPIMPSYSRHDCQKLQRWHARPGEKLSRTLSWAKYFLDLSHSSSLFRHPISHSLLPLFCIYYSKENLQFYWQKTSGFVKKLVIFLQATNSRITHYSQPLISASICILTRTAEHRKNIICKRPFYEAFGRPLHNMSFAWFTLWWFTRI